MENEMNCDSSLSAPSSLLGYVCSGIFPILGVENTFYIKCEDQPWFNNSEDRNANQQSFVYKLKKPQSKISIESIAPSEDFRIATQYGTIELVVKTIGGGDKHFCSYSFSGYDKLIEIFETGGLIHKQPLNVKSGKNKIFVECKDETGDSVQGEISFNVIFDGSAPAVSRVWQEGGKLNLVTSEISECSYSTKNCGFSFESGEKTIKSDKHIFSLEKGKTYYIKCKDEFGNLPSGCSITVVGV
jgi:hypothetical protein